ncbi:MAG TPA: hypothetical protein VNS57_05300, partial [Steroidobacteraceae bacterium]|nr:hypothetical protein [Steroidobacteraceae bacterium]
MIHPPVFTKRLAGLGLLVVALGGTARAGEPWIAPGNLQVRHDVQLLVDGGVIDLPTTYWPIATSDLANALDHLSRASTGEVGGTPGEDALGESTLTAPQLAAIARLRRIA